ncbi:MAG: arylsulfatase [Planctomycetia bacterium]|nr:arylsulfatase [Planctomycetia bacterium]
MNKSASLLTNLLASAGFAAVLACAAIAAAAESRPNIVLILADDLGYGDIKCLNPQGKIATPNVDALASQGMTFTDMHSGSAVCSPTRYGLLTGRYAWRTRLRSGVLAAYDQPLIAADRLTLPALLNGHGYTTACFGKWHLGWDWPRQDGKFDFTHPIANGPTTRGFDYYFGTHVPNQPPYCFVENDRTVGIPTATLPVNEIKARYLTSTPGPMLPGWDFEQILPTITERTVKYIGRRAADKRPFFLYMPLTTPHEPIAPSKAWQGKSGINPVADLIMETDWAVGQVLRELDKQSLANNTLVIFTADNGHSPYTGLEALLKHGHHPSGPFRGYKADIWDGGHHVPFIARWPGKVKAGSTCDDTACLCDMLATTADMLGVKLPDNAGEDSTSILPDLLGSAKAPIHEAIVHQGLHGALAIRQGRWKLEFCRGSNGFDNSRNPAAARVNDKEPPDVQLYDMTQDIGERKNVQGDHPEIVERLTRLLQQYIDAGRSTPGSPQKNDVPVSIVLPKGKAR